MIKDFKLEEITNTDTFREDFLELLTEKHIEKLRQQGLFSLNGMISTAHSIYLSERIRRGEAREKVLCDALKDLLDLTRRGFSVEHVEESAGPIVNAVSALRACGIEI